MVAFQAIFLIHVNGKGYFQRLPLPPDLHRDRLSMLSLTESDGAMDLITFVENGGIGGNGIAIDLKENIIRLRFKADDKLDPKALVDSRKGSSTPFVYVLLPPAFCLLASLPAGQTLYSLHLLI